MDMTTLSHFFSLYRNQMGYGIVATTINALAHWKRHDSVRDTVFDAAFCGVIGWEADHLLSLSHMPADAAVIASCIIGYIGASGISDFIKARLGLGAIKVIDTSAPDVRKE